MTKQGYTRIKNPSTKLEIIKNDMLDCSELTYKRRLMLIALSGNNGNVLQASIAAGLSREVHIQGMREENYRKFYERIIEEDLDWWESKLHNLGEKEDFNAIKFALQAKGKRRGYTTDNQITINNNNNTIVEIIYDDKPYEDIESIEVEEIKQIDNSNIEIVTNE